MDVGDADPGAGTAAGLRPSVVSDRISADLAWGLALAAISVLSVAGLLLGRSGAEPVHRGAEMGAAGSSTSVVPQNGGDGHYRTRYNLEARSPARYNLEAGYLQGMSRTTTTGTTQ